MPPRLDLQGVSSPVGPIPAYSNQLVRQARPRRRRCLLKGCEAWFRSLHPSARYCSDGCRCAARRWSQWRANRRYRQSEQGQACRRQQSRRRRERCRQRASPSPASEAAPREGYQEAASREKTSCSRPGCYKCFATSSRSPQQKFCSRLCRQALRCVLQREARWRRWFEQRGQPLRPPP